MKPMLIIAALVISIFQSDNASAFCGFYVAKANAKLFNEASQVVFVRDGDKTVLTMSNDYKGKLKQFAMVVPVPTVLKKKQIHVGDNKVIEHLDAYTAPRLVEYFDPDPCAPKMRAFGSVMKSGSSAGGAGMRKRKNKSASSLGVTIEAKYQVGEYDILILSAKKSDGLLTWLKQEKYKVPKGAGSVLKSYIKQGMKFFVAKVDLERQAKTGFSYLRPIQIAFRSKRFSLPIRLGMVNSKGTQDLFIYALTKKGRVESTNYRTTKIPTGMDVPVYLKNEFSSFYKDMFSTQVKKDNMKTVIMEYAWDMSWCDPCAAEPLSSEELRKLGVFWIKKSGQDNKPSSFRKRRPSGGAQNVFVTRLHVRYDKEHFPDDLKFQTTADRTNYQGRYVLRHAFKGEISCDAASSYADGVNKRQEKEAQALASLTGWDINKIRKKMKKDAPKMQKGASDDWIDGLWGD